jgi:serine/threonine-protein kinase RsbW
MAAPHLNEPILKRIHLKTPANEIAADDVLAWFEAVNDPPLDNPIVWWQCQTAFKEAFDNIVDHAHQGLPPDTPIEIEVIRFEQRIEMRLWDQGAGFDLLSRLSELPNLEDNDGDHGRGLKILERIADYLSYERTEDSRNCFLLIKKYPQP